MCDERERLIGYVYDECDPVERRAIEAHLDGCHACRYEIAGLRKVRQDLLAWDVPEQPPVWRPMVPAVPASSRSSVPAWALTAAAGLFLMVGAAGGAATYALLPHRQPSATAAAAAPTAVDAKAVEALTRRVAELERAQAELASNATELVSNATADADQSRIAATTSDLARKLRAVEQRQDELAAAMTETTIETARLNKKQVAQENLLRLTSFAQGGQAPSGFGGSR